MLVLEWSRVRRRTADKLRWVMSLALLAVMTEVLSLSGPNICIVKQKYNITKRVKYRAPMSVRTYEWCLAVPPRCSRYTTEMRDLTRLETEERTAEAAVCCPGYKMKGDFTCAPICPLGKTGIGCDADCPSNKWGPNCVHDCKKCSDYGKCSPITGECICHTGWQGESCETSMSTTTSTTTARTSLLTTSIAELTTSPTTTSLPLTTPAQTQTTITTIKATTSQAVTEDLRRKDSKVINAELSRATVPKVKIEEESTRDLKFIRTEHSSTRRSDENTTTSLTDRIYGTNTTDFVTKKLTSTNSEAGKDNDDVSHATNTNTTNPLSENTDIIDKISKTAVYNNSTITPWTFAVTKTISTAMTTIATTKLQATDSVILSTTIEIPRKILPFTKVETKTKSTSKETETTKKPEPTRIITTTAKFKPKEIWIKPAQKGEMPFIESKIKSHEVSFSKPRHSTVKEPPATTTTPRTIIVSIIPTSMSYSTFKKISLTTASAPHTQQYKTSRLMDLRDITVPNRNAATSTPFSTTIQNSTVPKKHHITTTMAMPTTKSTLHGSKAPPILTKTTKYLYSEATNSMSMTNEVNKLNYPPSIPTITSTRKEITAAIISGTVTTVALPRNKLLPLNNSTVKIEVTSTLPLIATPKSERNKSTNIADKEQNKIVSTGFSLERNVNSSSTKEKTKISTEAPKKLTTLNISENISTNKVTNADIKQDEEETFHILTEPEHITAVAGERPSEMSTVDLIYVLTIVGGMVIGIITIAVVIVMFERCKRQRYGDIMKMNNIRMQVVIDNNDRPPPPYVRSIFRTPLPDPPMSEKCHYQPISTLDRNLKQFMRPVVVQAISPLMLENFRGILECHYDHLPIRSHDFQASECGRACCSITPSVVACVEPQTSRVNSVTESTIETLKCEADVDEIEASEPLYAEIPCWRPPSARAVEVVNVNGEAITEL